MYKISTIGSIVNLHTKIDLKSFIEHFEHKSIIYKTNDINFGNQITLIVKIDKDINIKIFSNGILQITGLKENYLSQIESIIDIFKNNINYKFNVFDKNITIQKHDIGFLLYDKNTVIGRIDDKFKIIGYIKKNNNFFINNTNIISFDKVNKLYTEFKHINKEKLLFSVNGICIGKIKYILNCDYTNNQDNSRIYTNTIDLDVKSSNNSSFDSDFYERKSHNLIIKNKIMIKYNDNLYILFNKNVKYILNRYYKTDCILFLENLIQTNFSKYKTEKNVGISKIYNYIYSFIKVEYNNNYKQELEYTNNLYNNIGDNIDFNFKIFENDITDYTLKIANINSDFSLIKKQKTDTINIKMFIELFNTQFSNGTTIVYEPSRYPALKIIFKSLEGSIRIFKTFNCKISCKSIENTDKIYNIILKFIDDNYNNIINKYIKYTNEVSHLSIDDIF